MCAPHRNTFWHVLFCICTHCNKSVITCHLYQIHIFVVVFLNDYRNTNLLQCVHVRNHTMRIYIFICKAYIPGDTCAMQIPNHAQAIGAWPGLKAKNIRIPAIRANCQCTKQLPTTCPWVDAYVMLAVLLHHYSVFLKPSEILLLRLHLTSSCVLTGHMKHRIWYTSADPKPNEIFMCINQFSQ